MKNLAVEFTIQYSKPKIQFSYKLSVQKWQAWSKTHYLNIQWADFENQDRVRTLREKNFWEMLVAMIQFNLKAWEKH